MKHPIDLEHWNRKEHFRFFGSMDDPFFGLTTQIDVTSINGYPSEELISNEIKASHSFVCENEQGELVGTFCYIEGIDPTYLKIYEGEWLNDEPYAVIHRMASNGKQKGISTECLKWAFAHCDNIRIDTHRDNIVMQNLLKKHGFKQCGIIYISNGTERIAFHKIVNATNKES